MRAGDMWQRGPHGQHLGLCNAAAAVQAARTQGFSERGGLSSNGANCGLCKQRQADLPWRTRLVTSNLTDISGIIPEVEPVVVVVELRMSRVNRRACPVDGGREYFGGDWPTPHWEGAVYDCASQ